MLEINYESATKLVVDDRTISCSEIIRDPMRKKREYEKEKNVKPIWKKRKSVRKSIFINYLHVLGIQKCYLCMQILDEMDNLVAFF